MSIEILRGVGGWMRLGGFTPGSGGLLLQRGVSLRQAVQVGMVGTVGLEECAVLIQLGGSVSHQSSNP